MYEDFINLLNLARTDQDYTALLQGFITNSVVDNTNTSQPLALGTIINVLERNSAIFNITIGHIDNEKPLNDFISENKLSLDLSYSDFCTFVLDCEEHIIVNNLITSEFKFVENE